MQRQHLGEAHERQAFLGRDLLATIRPLPLVVAIKNLRCDVSTEGILYRGYVGPDVQLNVLYDGLEPYVLVLLGAKQYARSLDGCSVGAP